jgi:hypothetical protein
VGWQLNTALETDGDHSNEDNVRIVRLMVTMQLRTPAPIVDMVKRRSLLCTKSMKHHPLALVMLALAAASPAADAPRLIEKAKVYPLAIDDAFEFRKTKTFIYDPRDAQVHRPAYSEMINFERQRVVYGAVNQVDRRERYGQYYDFFWRTKRPADVIVRFEYRQQNLGSYVQAQEIEYKGAKGSNKSSFKIVGDDYEQDGRVTAWRAIIIENGKIVGLNQSFLWN